MADTNGPCTATHRDERDGVVTNYRCALNDGHDGAHEAGNLCRDETRFLFGTWG